MDFQGRSIVVTGGAGHLGAGICKELAAKGARVLCLSSKVLEFDGESQICDVANEAELSPRIEQFAPNGIDGFVNCAGRASRGIDTDMPADAFVAGVNSLLGTTFTGAKVALRHMERGSIVNLASMWGLVSPNLKVYLNLKNEPSLAVPGAAGGILALTRYLATVAALQNVRVNALVPGWFPRKRGPDNPAYMHEIQSRIPMRRIGLPEEIVGPALFLLSDASSYMTGQQLVIDGGYSIQ